MPLKMDLPMTVKGADLDSDDEESSSEDEQDADDDNAMNEEDPSSKVGAAPCFPSTVSQPRDSRFHGY